MRVPGIHVSKARTLWGRRVKALLILGAVAALLPAAAAAEPVREIVINIPAFSLYLYEDGVRTAEYPIGVGRVVNPSQLGTTQIINKVIFPTYYPPDWYRQGLQPIPPGPENPVGTRWLGLGFRGYGIHGTNDPASIGTAASAGCIRMLNEHVEELAELVDVGTKVTFLYETIEAWRDPLTQTPYLRIYRDIYGQGTNTPARALAVLARIGADQGVDVDALSALLEEAAGVPRPVPQAVPLLLNDRPVAASAARLGERLLLPLDSLAALVGDEVTVSGHQGERRVRVGGRELTGVEWIGRRPYAAVERAAQALGLVVLQADRTGVHLGSVRVQDERGEPIPVRARWVGHTLLLPVQELAEHLGVDAAWDQRLQALRLGGRLLFSAEVIGGQVYLAYDRLAKHLGVEIRWEPEALAVTLSSSAFQSVSRRP